MQIEEKAIIEMAQCIQNYAAKMEASGTGLATLVAIVESKIIEHLERTRPVDMDFINSRLSRLEDNRIEWEARKKGMEQRRINR